MTDGVTRAIEKVARAAIPDEDIRRRARVERAIDNQGNVVIKGRQFLELDSPDGTTWRIRVDNTGTLDINEAPAV